MAERTKDKLVRDLELLVDWNPTSQRRIDICKEAADFIRSMPEGQEIVDYPHDITTRWLEHISGIKHSARATGKESPIHNLTSVESILKWWEEEVRPGLILQHREDKSNKPTHVCGLHGFDSMKGDVCPKCEQEQLLREGKSDD